MRPYPMILCFIEHCFACVLGSVHAQLIAPHLGLSPPKATMKAHKGTPLHAIPSQSGCNVLLELPGPNAMRHSARGILHARPAFRSLSETKTGNLQLVQKANIASETSVWPPLWMLCYIPVAPKNRQYIDW